MSILLRTSIRARVIAGLSIMLFPLTMVSIGAFFFLEKAIRFLQEIEEEIIEEVLPAARIRQLLARAYMPANDYIIHGNPNERETFVSLAQEVDEAFDDVLAGSLDIPEEGRLLLQAQEMWERGQEISNEILNLADPVGNRLAIDKMEIMDNYFDRVLIHIDRANVLMLREMKGYTSATRSYFKQVYVLVIGVIVTGTIISLVTALFLAKSILGPMQMQQSGVRKFGSGSLYHRIGRISSDELGELALVFDDMAGKLQEMAIRDSLTNLFNRREFHRYAAAEMGRSRRYAHPMALLMLDSDHFKTVNDQYGHQIEDEVLKAVAARISSSVRSMEHVSRYGGEEIATILPETGKEDALKAADHLRDTIEKQTFPLANGLEIALTASIGVAVFPEDARTENELVAAADAALYEAKKKGRNCVRAYRITA